MCIHCEIVETQMDKVGKHGEKNEGVVELKVKNAEKIKTQL